MMIMESGMLHIFDRDQPVDVDKNADDCDYGCYDDDDDDCNYDNGKSVNIVMIYFQLRWTPMNWCTNTSLTCCLSTEDYI